MLELFTQFVRDYGYFAVGLIVALEGIGFPVAGETVVVTAATFAARGSLSVVGVGLATIVGTFLGGTAGYWIGRIGGRRFLERHGHWIWLDERRLARTEEFFARRGVLTIFIGKYIGPVRMFASFLAGIACMPFATFTAVNLAAGAVWAIVFCAVGYSFGRNLAVIEEWFTEIGIVVAIVILLSIGVYWMRNRKSVSDPTG